MPRQNKKSIGSQKDSRLVALNRECNNVGGLGVGPLTIGGFIRVGEKQLELPLVIDIDASASLINGKLACRLEWRVDDKVKSVQHIVGPANEKLKIKGICNANVNINEKEIEVKLLVISGLLENVLIGTDVLPEFGYFWFVGVCFDRY